MSPRKAKRRIHMAITMLLTLCAVDKWATSALPMCSGESSWRWRRLALAVEARGVSVCVMVAAVEEAADEAAAEGCVAEERGAAAAGEPSIVIDEDEDDDDWTVG